MTLRHLGGGPLSGVRIVEIGRFISGPYAGQALADLGAEVVKVEQPGVGDPFRSFAGGLYGPHFVAYNRNKRSVCADLRTDEGKDLVLELAGTADVLLENMRPGVMSGLGLGYEDVRARNEAIVYCSLTGFGADGPYQARPAFDTIAQALSGMLSQTLEFEEPRIVGPAFSDGISGLTAANAILAALFVKERSGVGQHVDVSMLGSTLSFLTAEATLFLNAGQVAGPRYRPSGSQSFALRCEGGAVLAIHLSSPEKFWQGLVSAIERPDLLLDERFQSRAARVKNYEALDQILKDEFARRPRADWLHRLEKHDVPHAPAWTLPEVFDDEQVKHLQMTLEVEHPENGTVRTVAPAARFSATPSGDLQAPPALGEDTEQITGQLARDRRSQGAGPPRKGGSQ